MNLKPYPKYKDSGIQWIGKIPEGWEIKKLKFNYEIKPKSNLAASEGEEEGEYPFFTSGEDTKFTHNALIEGEFVIVGDGGIPNFKYYKGKFSYSDHCFLLKPKNDVNPKFLFYFLIGNLDSLDVLCFQGMGLRNLDKYKFNSFFSCIPSIEEQKHITNILDLQTSKINQIIEKDKKLIELLKERRTALINHAVTKGLDPSAKMKDSGIPWIGEVPEEWEINKIKNTSYVKGRIGWQGLTSEEYSETGAFLVTGTDFDNGNINWEDCRHVGWERYKEDPYIHLKKDDLLITKDGTIGKVALISKLPDKATLNSGIFLIRPLNKKYQTGFLYWVLNSLLFERFFDYVKTGATIVHLYQETFEKFSFPIPSKEEQLQISSYLDKATARIDKTIQKVEQKINLLEEYRKSLIHNVVTGKIDVREAKQ